MKENIVLRNLTAEDMFPMFNIISKIGIKEFKNCFDSEDVRKAVASVGDGNTESEESVQTVGIAVVMDIASIIVSNIGKCRDDIFQLLAQLSGLSAKEVAKLPMMDFVGMIIALVKKDEFKDFFQQVSALFK